jgi:Uncharacterized protein conserved in bacteria (DUF2188)
VGSRTPAPRKGAGVPFLVPRGTTDAACGTHPRKGDPCHGKLVLMPSIDLPLLVDLQVHVVPGRRGVWTVRATDDGLVASVHNSATEAERAAHRYAHARGATHVVVHDRYARVHTSPVAR